MDGSLRPRGARGPGVGAVALLSLVVLPLSAPVPAQAQDAADDAPALLETTLRRYCVTCHSERLRTAELSLEGLDLGGVAERGEVWEAVVRKLRARSMPPVGRPRPDPGTYDRLAAWIEGEIDRVALAAPDPGRTETFHRLNRTEYANAVRDLLAIDVDVAELLPADNFDEHGFDNMASVLTVSTSLMERYLSAARKIGRLAVGETPLGPAASTYKVPILLTQDDRMGETLPFGSRGGIGVDHYFPVDGAYDVEIRLHRNYVNYVRGMGSRHDLQVRLDGRLVRSFTIGGEEPEGGQAPASYAGNQFGDPAWEEYMLFADANLRVRFDATAGPHTVAVSFVRRFTEPEGVQQPRQSVFAVSINEMRDGDVAVEHMVVNGPFDSTGPGDTPSRRALFICAPETAAEEDPCARATLTRLARRAYRRPVDEADLAPLMQFYRAGREDGSFDAGIQLALERLLIAPDFLFRIERDPAGVPPGTVYALSDLELASRLSFFLWSSGPDAELLDLAAGGRLHDPAVLAAQARRMLGAPRATELVRNFAGQWLRLRDLAGAVPDAVAFPEFDENLRDAFTRETELFVESLLREDRSVLDLLGAGYTYANERLAAHYGIPNVYGSHFRRVELDTAAAERRGGILGHGSVLTVTSYPNRTSPVLRGKWILNNILGTPPPPPPPDVPDLPDRGEDGRPATVRQRLERHRENAVCATCHAPMDPLGLAMENYDAVGRWRTTGEAALPIDAAGRLPDGTAFDGPAGLRGILLQREDQFVATVTEKLLGYALGRGPEHHDRPTVRAIVRAAAADHYRWSSIIVGIVKSAPFRLRRTAS